MPQLFTCDTLGMEKFAKIVKSGGVVAFPTDTVYGIGCDPYNDSAVEKVFAVKSRDKGKALPVLVRDISTAEKLIELSEVTRQLASTFWPGGLTILAPQKDFAISPLVTANSGELALRVPANECLNLALASLKVIVGTSANLSGAAPAKTATDVINSKLACDCVLDGGRVSGVESTIIREKRGLPVAESISVVREGVIARSKIMAVIRDFEVENEIL